MQVWPGRSHPLGAHYDGAGTNFAVYSESAERVELCLLDKQGLESRLYLAEVDASVWHGYLPSVEPGQRYGYRVHGPRDSGSGQWHDPDRLLLDPCCRLVDVPTEPSEGSGPSFSSGSDSAVGPAIASIVVNPFFDWGIDRPPRTPLAETVLYRLHVRGMTQRWPNVADDQRGRYRGLAARSVVEHLRQLGVTAVVLLPVQQFLTTPETESVGLTEYWGFQTVAWSAVHTGYAIGVDSAIHEFKLMVRDLHDAGIEVIISCVLSSTGETRPEASISLWGYGSEYYRMDAATGAGGALDVNGLPSVQLMLDALRYWVTELHVDGFYVSDAAELLDQDGMTTMLAAIEQDPTLADVKLFAEPWRSMWRAPGLLPSRWSESNRDYSDWLRDLWRGVPSTAAMIRQRMTGSSELFGDRPYGSVNYVTSYSGFTLADLVSYDEKHNEANRLGGIDGDTDNRSWNSGVEGPSQDPVVVDLRLRQRKNLLATLLFTPGVPLLLAGDEAGNSQSGNNNASTQDNEIGWLDWSYAQDAPLIEWISKLVRLRSEYANLLTRPPQLSGSFGRAELLRPDGTSPPENEELVAWMLDLVAGPKSTRRFQRPDQLRLLMNPSSEPVRFVWPEQNPSRGWICILDSHTGNSEEGELLGPEPRVLFPRSLQLLLFSDYY